MNLALFSQSSATQKFWFRGSMARQWCVTGCPPAQLLNPRVPSLPQSHVPGVWKSVPDVQYFKCESLSDPESGKKEDIEPAFFLSHSGSTRLVFLLSSRQLFLVYFFFSLLHNFFKIYIYILILVCQNSRHENQFIFRETRSESHHRIETLAIRSWKLPT